MRDVKCLLRSKMRSSIFSLLTQSVIDLWYISMNHGRENYKKRRKKYNFISKSDVFAYLVHWIQINQFIDTKENNGSVDGHWPVSVSGLIDLFFGLTCHFLLLSNFLTEDFGRAQNLDCRFILWKVTQYFILDKSWNILREITQNVALRAWQNFQNFILNFFQLQFIIGSFHHQFIFHFFEFGFFLSCQYAKKLIF